jgi:hypothetical protein
MSITSPLLCSSARGGHLLYSGVYRKGPVKSCISGWSKTIRCPDSSPARSEEVRIRATQSLAAGLIEPFSSPLGRERMVWL